MLELLLKLGKFLVVAFITVIFLIHLSYVHSFLSHMCMMMRGVQKINATATTSCMLGVFREDPKTREEFLTLISKKSS